MSGAAHAAEHYHQTEQLAHVADFDAAASTEPDYALDAAERDKLRDLRADIIWLARRDELGRGSHESMLGRLYGRCERALGGTGRPPSAAHPLTQGLIEQGPIATPPDAPPKAAPATPRARDDEPFKQEYLLLDQLSMWYGGQYRGVIILNYGLAFLAGLCAVVERSIHYLDPSWGIAAEIILATSEFVLVSLIVMLYLLGRTPQSWFAKKSMRRPLLARRWHQRWIEYRLLAERFRYADLLEPFTGSTRDAWARLMRDSSEPTSWQDRYFLWRLHKTSLPRQDPGEWVATVRRTMKTQAAYHARTGARRRHFAQWLAPISKVTFAVSFAFAFIRLVAFVVSGWQGGLHNTPPTPHWVELVIDWSPIIAAFMAIIGATAHGTETSLELAKIAERSEMLAARIRDLLNSVDASWKPGGDIEALRGDVETFCKMVTEDASGWHSLLRDKNVPLPHS